MPVACIINDIQGVIMDISQERICERTGKQITVLCHERDP